MNQNQARFNTRIILRLLFNWIKAVRILTNENGVLFL